MATVLGASPPAMPACAHRPRPYAGPSRGGGAGDAPAVRSPRRLFTLYREPLMVVEGHMQYLWDETGRRYLDFFAGHRHGVRAATATRRSWSASRSRSARSSTRRRSISTRNLPSWRRSWPARCRPAACDVTYFINSGSEANDLAILMARDVHRQHRRHRRAQRLSRRHPRRDGAHRRTPPGSSRSAERPACTTPTARHPYRSPLAGNTRSCDARERAATSAT